MNRTLLLFLIALALTACGPARIETSETPQQPLPTASSDWDSIRFTQSGGIMGLLRTIEISRDGAWKISDGRADASVSGKLSAADLDQLNELIASLSIKSDKQFSVCADCFIFSVEIFSAGRSIAAQADSVTLEDSGLAPLADFMIALIARGLK